MLEQELKEFKAQRDDPVFPDRDEVLEEIARTEGVLTIIPAALDGSRGTMKLLGV